ncbi:BRO-N domain-containing protein [Amycolatopsis methanolica]|uniref:BRO-N domain-containing protein n=1 Tax=Amycolatopsis methanolica TaxID=1814 RepID=UPI0034152985
MPGTETVISEPGLYSARRSARKPSFRVIERDGDPWFVAKDVVTVLGIGRKPADPVKYLDDDEHTAMPFAAFSQLIGGESLSNHPDLNAFRAHGITLVNEPGLYWLILRSRKERAREFKRWVTHEVLPTLSSMSSTTTAPSWSRTGTEFFEVRP